MLPTVILLYNTHVDNWMFCMLCLIWGKREIKREGGRDERGFPVEYFEKQLLVAEGMSAASERHHTPITEAPHAHRTDWPFSSWWTFSAPATGLGISFTTASFSTSQAIIYVFLRGSCYRTIEEAKDSQKRMKKKMCCSFLTWHIGKSTL